MSVQEMYKTIGRNIAACRKVSNLTQQQLADKIGISKSYLSKIEAPYSEQNYSLAVLFHIAKGLDVKIVDLLRSHDSLP